MKTFTKKAFMIILVFSCICITASYILACLGKETMENLSIALVTAVIGSFVAYCLKSFAEKSSRNKHRLDENGNPHSESEAENEL